MQVLAWEKHDRALVDSLFCLCHARHASISADSTKKCNYIIHHLFMSCMNRTTKYVLDIKHHVQATGGGHECYSSGGCSQDTTFHFSVSVNTHSSIIWSTEYSYVIYEFEVLSPKVRRGTLQGVKAMYFILFYFIVLLRRHCDGHHTRTCFTSLLCHSWNQKTWIWSLSSIMEHCWRGHIRRMWLLWWNMHWQLVVLLDRHTVKNAINILGKHTKYLEQHVEKFDLTLWSVLWLPGGIRVGYVGHEGT